MKVRWTAKASYDLGEIARYIAEDSPDAALRVATAIFDTCESLSAFLSGAAQGVSPEPAKLSFRHCHISWSTA